MYKVDWESTEELRTIKQDGSFQRSFNYLSLHEKYQEVADLTLQELIKQLHVRAKIYAMFERADEDIIEYLNRWIAMHVSASTIIYEPFSSPQMINPYTMLSANELNQLEFLTWSGTREANAMQSTDDTSHTLSFRHSIKPISVATIKHMSAISHKNKFQDMDDFSARYIHHPITEAFAEKYKNAHGRLVALSINLSDYSDDEILNDLRHLLENWRKETKTAAKPDPSKASNTNLKKIINNKYIQSLDGMIMSRLFNGAITDEQLIKHIYPHLEIQADSFRKTYKNNARAFANAQCLAVWEKTLTDLGLWDQPVQQVLQKKF